MLNVRNDLKRAGLSASRNAPGSASIRARSGPIGRPTLAGHKNRILNNPKFWIKIAPIALERHLQAYINAQELLKGTNPRSKYMNRLHIKKNNATTKAHQAKLENAKIKLLEAMEEHSNNFTSVIRRSNEATDPKLQR